MGFKMNSLYVSSLDYYLSKQFPYEFGLNRCCQVYIYIYI